ncbi:hypothetical protein [Dactylosporangium sp. NPDC048998]|uniref:hypothetical protein n=1 Tax=Dactylosporangium sp. NPDC048998 TaxID=3363976 RepID=UPI00371528DC
MSRVVRLVLALYPRAVRDRYGAEIADLLAHSRRPVRDLADVARCALAERARGLTYARLRPHLDATAGLVVAPVAFAGAYLAFFFLCQCLLLAAAAAGAPVGGEAAGVVQAAATLPVAAGAIWLARHARLPFSAALAPTALTAGTLPLALLLAPAGMSWPTAAALGCWWVTIGALSTVAVALVRRGHRRRAVLTMALGGLVACELAVAVYSLAVFGSPSRAFGTYPVTVLGIDPRVIGDPAGRVADALTILPALLTACTAYALGLATARSAVIDET